MPYSRFSLNNIRKQDIQFIALVLIAGFMLSTYITSLSAFVSPTSTLRWETSVYSFDQSDYSRGDPVTLTGFLEEGTSYYNLIQYYYFLTGEPITWTVIVLSPSNMPIYITSDVIADAQGDITLDPISFTLASSAELGTYKVRIIVWSDFLPSGATRTNAIHEDTFEVVS